MPEPRHPSESLSDILSATDVQIDLRNGLSPMYILEMLLFFGYVNNPDTVSVLLHYLVHGARHQFEQYELLLDRYFIFLEVGGGYDL